MLNGMPIYVNSEYIKNLVNDKDAINQINSMIYEHYIICKNPLKNKKMTLGEYNNWVSDSPKFTWGDYNKRWGTN